ncbi:serine/threonine protein kinase [Vibrio astriarenae]|nr:serine/threonine protein kinase [Vibrio sp. C7]
MSFGTKNQSQDNLSALIVEINHLPNHSQLEYQQNILTRAIPPALAEGNTLEGYHIDKVLHAGTRSHVYQVTEQSTGEQYVLKTPSECDADNALVLQQFANEYWVSTQLNSERIMKMYPTAKTSQFIYQLCEHIEGVTLRQWMYDNPMPELSRVRVMLDEIVKALRIFQRAEMVHRDLKPENIMITTTGAIKIIDFGAVKVSSLKSFPMKGGQSFRMKCHLERSTISPRNTSIRALLRQPPICFRSPSLVMRCSLGRCHISQPPARMCKKPDILNGNITR